MSEPGTGGDGKTRTDRPAREDTREQLRQQMIANIGGWSGALITAIPTVVFVIVNVTSTLTIAIIAAVGAALALTVYRFVRHEPVQHALSGLFGVLIAAVIAARTGQARGYFLLGIWTSFAYAVPFLISVLVRRPLVGLIWEFLDPTPAEDGSAVADEPAPDDSTVAADRRIAASDADEPTPWHKRRPLLVAYTWATLAATAVFLARGIVQWRLYGDNATGWLAFARIAMGYPLFVAAVGFAFFVVTRARRRITRDGAHAPGDA